MKFIITNNYQFIILSLPYYLAQSLVHVKTQGDSHSDFQASSEFLDKKTVLS